MIDVDQLVEDAGYRNRSQRGAYRKGVLAFIEGKPYTRESCPYPDHRTDRGSVTFSRTFIRAWEQGWKDAEKESNEQAGTDEAR